MLSFANLLCFLFLVDEFEISIDLISGVSSLKLDDSFKGESLFAECLELIFKLLFEFYRCGGGTVAACDACV